MRGLREEAEADPAAAPLVPLADAAYDAQHPVAGDPAVWTPPWTGSRRGSGHARPSVADRAPRVWRTTIADAAADLDVIDLRVLVESWARGTEDWRACRTGRSRCIARM